MNTEKLRELYQQNEATRAIFQALASRDRPRETTDLRRLKNEILHEQGLTVDWDALLAVFKRLEALKVGQLTIGRGVEPHRFRWNYNLKEVGSRAMGGAGTTAAGTQRTSTLSGLDTKTYVYPIRGKFIQLELPADLKKSEAEGLAEFLKALTR